MNEQIVTKQHMDALRALSDINLKVSDARARLSELETQETEYLISREKKTMERVTAVLENSRGLVEEANKNYDLISDFARSITEGWEMLKKTVASFKELTKSKEEYFTAWERDIQNQTETVTTLRNAQKVEATALLGMKSELDMAKKELKNGQIKLETDRGEVERMIKRLKANKV